MSGRSGKVFVISFLLISVMLRIGMRESVVVNLILGRMVLMVGRIMMMSRGEI